MDNRTTYYTDRHKIEPNAAECLAQFESMDNIDRISVFPDIHYCAEKAIPVGVAFKASDVFYPLITGKDMGCGVAYFRIAKKDYIKPFDKVKHYRAFERESQTMTDEGLGGGNHFLALEESDEYLYIIVHTGSRNLGIYMFQENYHLLQTHNPGQEWLPIEFASEKYVAEYDRVLKYASNRRLEFLTKTWKFLVKNGYVRDSLRYEYEDSCHNLLQFTKDGVIHRKGSTQLLIDSTVVIPLSMSRGSLIVQGNKWDVRLEESLFSCSHGAGRKYSRTDTLKHWHSLKRAEKEEYKNRFSEILNRSGEFDSSIIQEFDFAYKSSDSILETQPYLIKVDETRPIATVKFTGV
jgi:release factor H-coupled RctB family protein